MVAIGAAALRERTPLLVATRNPGKLAELRTLFTSAGYEVIDLTTASVPQSAAEDTIEAFESFEANAVAKARFYHEASGGLATVADDSGLVVEALGGAPGVHSRRWSAVAGAEAEITAANNAKLLRELDGERSRRAHFVCVVAYTDGTRLIVERGETVGRIAVAPRGTTGFGYDPLFESADLGWQTFGEVHSGVKARVSHRGRAFAQLGRRLRDGVAGCAG